VNNPFFENYLKKLRLRFTTKGGILPFKSAFRHMVRNRDKLTLNVIAGDQTPTRDEINFWTTFLNQPTAVFLGIEKIAQSLDFAVLFFDIQRSRQGYYIVTISLLEDNPRETGEAEITGKHVSKLEEVIRRQPDNWLWSHQRWKHQPM
jgi:KDO2-lipid IV(A) lauroyltransferase